jgi:hypothetical protein
MPDTKTTDATSGRTAPKEKSADAEPLTTGSVDDKEYLTDVPTQDSAGLTREETERRVKQSHDQRAELFTELERQGNAADGDSVGPRTTPRPHDEAGKAKERASR